MSVNNIIPLIVVLIIFTLDFKYQQDYSLKRNQFIYCPEIPTFAIVTNLKASNKN